MFDAVRAQLRKNHSCMVWAAAVGLLKIQSTLPAYLWAFRARIHLRYAHTCSRAPFTILHFVFFNSELPFSSVHWSWFPKKFNFPRVSLSLPRPFAATQSQCVRKQLHWNNRITMLGFMFSGNVWRPFELCNQIEYVWLVTIEWSG